MSTLCFLGIEILEAIKGVASSSSSSKSLLARLVILLPSRVGMCFALGGFVPEGGVRSVVVVLSILVLEVCAAELGVEDAIASKEEPEEGARALGWRSHHLREKRMRKRERETARERGGE